MSQHNYHFRIKTSSGSIVSASAYGHNFENAKFKLYRQYPGCIIIDMWE